MEGTFIRHKRVRSLMSCHILKVVRLFGGTGAYLIMISKAGFASRVRLFVEGLGRGFNVSIDSSTQIPVMYELKDVLSSSIHFDNVFNYIARDS